MRGTGGSRVGCGRSGVGFGGLRKRGLCRSLIGEIEKEITELIGITAGQIEGGFEAIELRARTLALSIAARMVERLLNADKSDYQGTSIPCRCGQRARYVGRRKKILRTALGELAVFRAYYHCIDCNQGFCPRDRELGLECSSFSPGALRMIALVGATVSFEEGSELLAELGGISIPPKSVERAAEALGREIERDELNQTSQEDRGQLPDTLYLGMDGTGIPMRRAELRGRRGKQPDGSSRTREVKLCTVWSAEDKDKYGVPVRDPGSVSYTAAIESAASSDTGDAPSAFAQRVMREAQRRGFTKAKRQVIVADGAPFIWNIADEFFPNAIQIVDRFHVKQHLHEVAKAIFGTPSDLGKQWAQKRCEELDCGDLHALINRLKIHASTCDAARKCAAYIQRNQHRMRYDVFHSDGLCTSSGVVEAGCKVAIGTRLKRAGMHWSLAGANSITALRCAKLSDRLKSFWQRRSTHPDRQAA